MWPKKRSLNVDSSKRVTFLVVVLTELPDEQNDAKSCLPVSRDMLFSSLRGLERLRKNACPCFSTYSLQDRTHFSSTPGINFILPIASKRGLKSSLTEKDLLTCMSEGSFVFRATAKRSSGMLLEVKAHNLSQCMDLGASSASGRDGPDTLSTHTLNMARLYGPLHCGNVRLHLIATVLPFRRTPPSNISFASEQHRHLKQRTPQNCPRGHSV